MQSEHSRYPRKINLGCGFDLREGFLNVDYQGLHQPDLVCDITNLQILPANYFEYALANDVLEHIPRLKIRNTLREWNRILVKDGVLELRVPSATGLLSLLEAEENKTIAEHDTLLQCLFGTQSYHGDFHYFAFTEIVLEDMLTDTGFVIDSIEVEDQWRFWCMAHKHIDQHVDDIFFLADNDFVTAAYQTLLARQPDKDGFDYYLGLIKSGIAREAVIEALKNSEEYLRQHSKIPT